MGVSIAPGETRYGFKTIELRNALRGKYVRDKANKQSYQGHGDRRRFTNLSRCELIGSIEATLCEVFPEASRDPYWPALSQSEVSRIATCIVHRLKAGRESDRTDGEDIA